MGRTNSTPSMQDVNVFGIPLGVSDALLIALVPILVYGAAFVDQSATIKYFNVPMPPGTISTASLFSAVISLALVFWIFIGSHVFIKLLRTLLCITGKRECITGKGEQSFGYFESIHISIIIIAALSCYFLNNGFGLVFLVFTIVLAVYDFIFHRNLNSVTTKKTKSHDVRPSLVSGFSTFVYFRSIPIHLRSIYTLVIVLIIIGIFIWSKAQYAIAIRNSIIVLDSNPSEVLLYRDGERYVFGNLIEGTKQLSNRFKIVGVSPDKPLILRHEDSGPILPAQKTPMGGFLGRPLITTFAASVDMRE